MRNLLTFLAFVALSAAVVGLLFLWKSTPVQAPALAPSARSLLEQTDEEFTSLVGRVLPSVVSINALPADAVDPRAALLRRLIGSAPEGGQPPDLGSGAIVSGDGYIVTNWHVIAKAAAVEIHLNDGRTLPAKFVGADRMSDVAILKIEAAGLSPLEFGNSDEVRIGQMVIAVGNPFGLQETVTKGIVSGKGRRMMSEEANDFLQTDAPINPGNSGGPLVDRNGKIIAINNAVIRNTDGIGFAIPANAVKRIFESIRDFGRVIRPWFGVSMMPLTPGMARELNLPDARGAFVQSIMAGSPAARAGLEPGDVIVSYNGRPVADWSDLRNRVVETEPGKLVVIGVLRAGKPLTLQATIEKQPAD